MRVISDSPDFKGGENVFSQESPHSGDNPANAKFNALTFTKDGKKVATAIFKSDANGAAFKHGASITLEVKCECTGSAWLVPTSLSSATGVNLYDLATPDNRGISRLDFSTSNDAAQFVVNYEHGISHGIDAKFTKTDATEVSRETVSDLNAITSMQFSILTTTIGRNFRDDYTYEGLIVLISDRYLASNDDYVNQQSQTLKIPISAIAAAENNEKFGFHPETSPYAQFLSREFYFTQRTIELISFHRFLHLYSISALSWKFDDFTSISQAGAYNGVSGPELVDVVNVESLRFFFNQIMSPELAEAYSVGSKPVLKNGEEGAPAFSTSGNVWWSNTNTWAPATNARANVQLGQNSLIAATFSNVENISQKPDPDAVTATTFAFPTPKSWVPEVPAWCPKSYDWCSDWFYDRYRCPTTADYMIALFILTLFFYFIFLIGWSIYKFAFLGTTYLIEKFRDREFHISASMTKPEVKSLTVETVKTIPYQEGAVVETIKPARLTSSAAKAISIIKGQ